MKAVATLISLLFWVCSGAQNPKDNKATYSLNTITKSGLFTLSNCVAFSATTIIMIEKEKKFRFGIGAGFEYLNRGYSLISLYQIPVFFSQHYILGVLKNNFNSVFISTEFGKMNAISGSYTDDRPNGVKNEIAYTESQLSSGIYAGLGFGFTESKFFCELQLRNQAYNITYPTNSRFYLFGFNLGVKL